MAENEVFDLNDNSKLFHGSNNIRLQQVKNWVVSVLAKSASKGGVRCPCCTQSVRYGMRSTKGWKCSINRGQMRLLYSVWWSMHRRCYNPNDSGYENYGGRGIKICDRWFIFRNFVEDMGVHPSENDIFHLDRKNNDGNYEPGNCRWVSCKVNQNNKRSNVFLSYGGETLTLKQWSEKLGISYPALVARNRKNMPVENILFGVDGGILFEGVRYSIVSLAAHFNMNRESFRRRFKKTKDVLSSVGIMPAPKSTGHRLLYRIKNDRVMVRIRINKNKKIVIGTFNTIEEALEARDNWLTENNRKIRRSSLDTNNSI